MLFERSRPRKMGPLPWNASQFLRKIFWFQFCIFCLDFQIFRCGPKSSSTCLVGGAGSKIDAFSKNDGTMELRVASLRFNISKFSLCGQQGPLLS
jgi:hypothetical protein